MGNRLNCVLLIDDNIHDIFFHKMVIEESGCAEKIEVAQTAPLALSNLKSKNEQGLPLPELILLDFHLPAMNGLEFLEAYDLLGKDQFCDSVVVILSTSLSPTDKESIQNFSKTVLYRNKPLTPDVLNEILDLNF